jgi:hypothetical protein
LREAADAKPKTQPIVDEEFEGGSASIAEDEHSAREGVFEEAKIAH